MKILRLLTIRILLCAGLVAVLAMPPKAAATTARKTTTKSTVKTKTHKAATKKAIKKTAKKTAKKPFSPAAKPVHMTGKYVSAAGEGITILTNPSTNAEGRWEIFEKYPLQINKHQGAWLEVTDFEGDTGWIKDSQVTNDKTVIVCKKRITLRQDPNADSNNPIVANVRYGVIFTPLEKNGAWLKVRYDAKTEGWLGKDTVWPSNPLD